MKRRVRQTLLIETEEISLLIDRGGSDFMMCDECGGENFMLVPEKLSEATGFPTREIYRLVESGKVHFVDRGRLFVCLTSLLAKGGSLL